jgi:hypothetical protein
MVCVRVPLLLRRNVGVLFGVRKGPRSDVLLFLARYGAAIILWVLYLYISLYFGIPDLYEIYCMHSNLYHCDV